MLQIELDCMRSLMSACRDYVKNSEEIDWEQRRYEIAKDAMINLKCSGHCGKSNIQEVASFAIKMADELIKQLKESKNK